MRCLIQWAARSRMEEDECQASHARWMEMEMGDGGQAGWDGCRWGMGREIGGER
jgi:hypothetical protein